MSKEAENLCVRAISSLPWKDYLYVTYDDKHRDECSSHVGKLGKYQPIFLGDGCESFVHAAHEVGHALGLYHTQSRHDRDQYIELQEHNIQKKGLAGEFVKFTENQNENYGLPYDYGSIMHYQSPIENPLMIPANENYKTTMGSPMISFVDLLMINTHYNCTDKCPSETSADCKNGGFPHPRDCKKCICPGGYGGALCDQLPMDCQLGKVLEASSIWNPLEASVQNTKSDGSYATCTYWIKAPNGKIQIKFGEINNAFRTVGCQRAGVEIKANEDQRLTGYSGVMQLNSDVQQAGISFSF
ncbi:astacin [Ancylostoma duodenale]|uniref:Metalloendopeptidase n=1 Tax=Ancylostoma duodenale TaxID=51022 RepID=A0A0C2GVQ8_9BILA|nr:astacin [Ancylostoma duodenale]